MPYLVVALVSLCVGGLVYVMSIRVGQADAAAVGFGLDPTSAPEQLEAAPGYTYLQVPVTRGPSLRQRLQGLVGSLVVIVAGALALAGALYAIGWLVARTIERFLTE